MAKKRNRGQNTGDPDPTPAFNIVVYCNSGPDDSTIGQHAKQAIDANSPWGSEGGLGYLVLLENEFNQLWNLIERGDTYGPAYSVLAVFGPDGEQFIGRELDFMFGWIGHDDKQYGRMLILQVIPRPHLWNALK